MEHVIQFALRSRLTMAVLGTLVLVALVLLVFMGGLVSSTILTLLVVPALYKWFAVAVEPEAQQAEGQFSTVVGRDVGVAQGEGAERE